MHQNYGNYNNDSEKIFLIKKPLHNHWPPIMITPQYRLSNIRKSCEAYGEYKQMAEIQHPGSMNSRYTLFSQNYKC